MAGTEDILETLSAALAVALGCEVIKGFPDWARPTVAPPLAALEITAWGPGLNRVGQRLARQTVTYRLFLFARHEPGLCVLLDSLVGWAKETPALTVAGVRVDLVMSDGLRYAPDTAAQQEQHGFMLTLLANW